MLAVKLIFSLTTRTPITFRACEGGEVKDVEGIVNAVEAEDGSGKSFNVKLLVQLEGRVSQVKKVYTCDRYNP